ncbi:MAG TPA: Gfo/Idh/MocA family oxidoreductase [Firmicutes bacterium]|nr:Gfo/Idh/MocA family oxidoreductase [Bacillota bacterium]
MTKIRIGVAGLIHDHIWHVASGFLTDPRCEVVAVADINPSLQKKALQDWSVSHIFDSYEEMMDKISPDAVLVYTDNASAADIVEYAAERGIHALVEKPMAATLEQADRMLIAAKKHGITLMVNWPTAWSRAHQAALEIAKRGDIGDIYKVRYRAAHQGPKEIGCSPFFYEWLYDKKRNGAGALMDYCCYGADYAAYLMGRPNAVVSVAGRFIKDYITVDDNAVIVAKYPHGLAICEASWTQYGFGYELMINGSAGSVRSDGKRVYIADERQKEECEISAPELPIERSSAAAYFLTCLIEHRPIEGLCNAVVSRNAQEILEAGILSAESGTAISLPVVSRR